MIELGDRICVTKPMPKQWGDFIPRTGIVVEKNTKNKDPTYWSYWLLSYGGKKTSGYDEVVELISRKQRRRT